ncbi:hypothetical protein PV04_10833 [Phialophora macrospora]|uniref:Uncharacterized protein n=1 Tax=Phialophora macrospora TaxID=1851006 RepID=A0A0D2F6W5_9EURO|nr:hypothetical protein PV04_10833 [Phialophora macrospora]
MGASDELSRQWRNPSDTLSLLLLIGGEIVQRAVAQLFGVHVKPAKWCPRIYLTPVAFSFGWVGFAFMSLSSIIGDKQLMPAEPDGSSIVVNCDTGYTRTNRSWLLGRILRDRELAVEANPGPEEDKLKKKEIKELAGLREEDPPPRVSLRIDIFELQGDETGPSIDHVCVLGWLTIAAQLGISIIPWALYGDWIIFLVTAAGTLFALLTGSLHQWNCEKWPGRRLNPPEKHDKSNKTNDPKTSPPPNKTAMISVNTEVTPDMEKGLAGPLSPKQPHGTSTPRKGKTKTICLTRGNGHRYAMILLCSQSAWDLETLATATSDSLPETSWCLLSLAVLWICLLISVSGLESHTWFLLLIGGLGMLQNVYVASAPRKPETLGLRMKPFAQRPTILGTNVKEEKFWLKPGEAERWNDEKATPDHALVTSYLEPWQTVGVRGAIRELEKTVPKAGMAIMPEFFPAVWRVEKERYRDKKEEKFWQWMFLRPRKEDRPDGTAQNGRD